jgi:hypothetical protein
MKANVTLPDSVPHQKVISTCACGFVPYVERLAKVVGVRYLGPQPMEDDTLHYFVEPVTGSSIALWDVDLSIESLQASMKAARTRFGVA